MRELRTALALLIAISMLTLFCPVMASPGYLQWKRDVQIYGALSPYGVYNNLVSMYKLMDDGVANYDWFYYTFLIQTVPGRVEYHNSWCTDKHWAWQRLWPYGTSDEDVVDYGPTTTSGTTGVSTTYTVQALVSKEGPAIGGSISWTTTYSISDVIVRDKSNIAAATDRVEWEHELKDFAEVSKYTYAAKPAFVVKDNGGYCFCDGQYSVTFCKKNYFLGIVVSISRVKFTTLLFALDCPDSQKNP
ncbi:MAG: hypothetical protein OEY81_04395 [Candidatus Bathyarchaeota archaeon]|nr:hypothetical protein [Candidatus Bathyarchaeota archaeon]